MDVDRKMAAEEHGLKTELCLGMPSDDTIKVSMKRGFSETVDLKLKLHRSTGESSSDIDKSRSMENKSMLPPKDPIKPPHKAQMVGWPPVRSFRRNVMTDMFVKVSMDGAPYLRKVDLKTHDSYRALSDALRKMFRKAMDVLNSSEYVATYEDKDGDWMLLGDVPWEMFVDSCKRIRIMKGCEAIGLAPRAVDKCMNRC